MATVSGWGRVKFFKKRTPIDLMYVSVPLISNENCIKPHTKYNSSDITSNMLCAGGSVFDGGPLGDACSGKEFCTNLLFCIYLGYFSLVFYSRPKAF